MANKWQINLAYKYSPKFKNLYVRMFFKAKLGKRSCLQFECIGNKQITNINYHLNYVFTVLVFSRRPICHSQTCLL